MPEPSHNRDLFSLLWVLLSSVVRDEILNQKKEVERHRQSEGYWVSECITQVLKDDVSDRAQLCCEDLAFEAFDSVSWESVKICAALPECVWMSKKKKKKSLLKSSDTVGDPASGESYRP